MRRAARQMGTTHKYRAIPAVVDGIRFDSKAEAKRYGELKLLEKAGEIWDLLRQVHYPLHAFGAQSMNDKLVGRYVADFSYRCGRGHVVEDVKGWDTPLSKWKRKHVKAQYGIDVQIVRVKG